MTEDALPPDSLLAVTREQQTLLAIAGDVFATSGRWAVYQYVQARMFDAGLDVDAVAGTLPALTHGHLRYAPVRFDLSRTPDSLVRLTIAGFSCLPAGSDLVDVFLTVLRELAVRRARAEYDPHQVIEVDISGSELLADLRLNDHPLAAVLPDILAGEPATWHGTGARTDDGDWRYSAGPFLRRFQDVTDVNDYLRRLRAFVMPPTPAAAPEPVYVPALGLATAFDHLNTVWRLRFGADLLTIPSVERSARLASDVTTVEEFDSRISALGEMFKGFDPPGDERTGPFQRMRIHLRDQLSGEEMGRVNHALKTLQSATHVRNAGQHMRAATDAATAMPTLGLVYPITDFERAWNLVRGHVTAALDTIREEIYASVPPQPRRQPPSSSAGRSATHVRRRP